MEKQNNIVKVSRIYGTKSVKPELINLLLKRIENDENLSYNDNSAEPVWEVGESA